MSETKDGDWLDALDALPDPEDADENDSHQEDPAMSEAERVAATAPAPKIRGDGKIVGSEGWKRTRQLTPNQINFANGVIEGKSIKQAYKDAYPDSKATDATTATSAYKLARHPRVSQYIRDAWEQTQDALVDDIAASKRYVMRNLVALSKESKTEMGKLRALELLGRTAGMFKDTQKQEQKPITAAELKAQLAGHLKLVGRDK